MDFLLLIEKRAVDKRRSSSHKMPWMGKEFGPPPQTHTFLTSELIGMGDQIYAPVA